MRWIAPSSLAGALLPLLASLTVLPGAATAADDTQALLEACLEASSVPHNKPGTCAWSRDVAPFNTRLPYTPIAIAVPRELSHIEDAVRCAAELGVKVSAKCGGHSYASLGLGGEDGHLVIELDRMHRVELGEDGTAVVQGGARLGHVAVELWEQGGRAVSHGTCPGVGISGHALHGGFGMSSFTHGLALDAITAATVVLANGTTVRASEDAHADLFWALRGAGSSMGVVAELELATFEPPAEFAHFEVQMNWTDVESAVDGWMKLQAWGEEEMPREMNLRITVDGRGVSLDGLYHGGLEEMREIVLPLVERLGGGRVTANVTYDWMEQVEAYAFTTDLNMTHPYNMHENFYSKSLFTHALPRAAVESFVTYAFGTAASFIEPPSAESPFPNRFWWIIVDIHGGANSRISEIPHDSTSYAHRDKLLLFQFYDRVFGADGYPEDEAEGFALLDGFVESITDEVEEGSWGMYLNYADPRVADRAGEVYWGENLGRLREVKRDVDPEDLFYNPLGIRPAE